MARKKKTKKERGKKKPSRKNKRKKIKLVMKERVLSKAAKAAADKIESGLEMVRKTKIRVIGIGGGAGNIVSEIALRLQASKQPVRASFVVANTDSQALKSAGKNVIRFQFGEGLTGGLGAGNNAELAAQAAQKEKEKIKKLFLDQDLCILVASLGGGTGSGAGPVFARIARNIGGVMTLGVFTLPFKFEGEKKLEVARAALQKLKPYLNTISVLPNEKIFQVIDKNTPLKEALSFINKGLAESLQGLIETIYLPGLINIDFADLRTILQGQGRLTFLNSVEAEGQNRVAEAIKKVINCPLYPYTIKGARGVLFNIAGEKQLCLSEVSQISKTISELANSEAKIIFGISESSKFRDKIKVNLLATGCTAKVFSEEFEEIKMPAISQKGSQKSKKQKKDSKLGKLAKKIKIKISQKPKKQFPPAEMGEDELYGQDEETKVRKNALQIKRDAENVEKELLEKEEAWESPAFLRREQNKQNQPEK
jgi:cell division protein FtsZ